MQGTRPTPKVNRGSSCKLQETRASTQDPGEGNNPRMAVRTGLGRSAGHPTRRGSRLWELSGKPVIHLMISLCTGKAET